MKDKNDWIALILVVWVMVILIAIVGEFSYSMRTEINITRNFKEEEEAYQLALAGIEYAKIEIMSAEESLYVYLNKDNILVFANEDENPVRKRELENGTFSYTIADEDGKLNINKASLPQLKYIVTNSGVDITEVDTIVDSIIDWRDTDNLHLINGAEEDYYRSLENPYSCKDGPFDIINELLLVKDVNPEIFYGSEEKESDEEKQYKGIEQYFTTWGPNTVNINTAPKEVLEALLGIPAADNIIKQRETGPITVPQSGGKVNSFFFTVTSTGNAVNSTTKRTIKAAFKKNGKELEILYWNDNFIG